MTTVSLVPGWHWGSDMATARKTALDKITTPDPDPEEVTISDEEIAAREALENPSSEDSPEDEDVPMIVHRIPKMENGVRTYDEYRIPLAENAQFEKDHGLA